jgi:hypothetical protein
VAAIALGLLILAMGALGVVLDAVTHYPGSGGPVVDSARCRRSWAWRC